MNIGIIILAAGTSSRMGKPKQLLKINNTTLLNHVIRIATDSKIGDVGLVLGANSDLISKSLKEYDDLKIIVNPDWQMGMSNSLQKGLVHFIHQPQKPDGVLVLLGDMPLISIALLTQYVTLLKKHPDYIITATYENTLGVPTLYSSLYFDELLSLNGKEGAKKVIYNHKEKVKSIYFENGKIDIDTPNDYKIFINSGKY